MIVIGELINGMYKSVTRAITNKDARHIQRLAADQVKSGAAILDLNAGPYSEKPIDDMKWLVETVQGVVSVPLSIDSARIDVMEAAMKIASNRVVINSTNADDDRMAAIFALVKRHGAQVIGVATDKDGVPDSKEKRVELAAKIISKASEFGIPMEDLYLDPIAMPVNVAQGQGVQVMESIRDFRALCEPALNTVMGLSNVSQGAKKHRDLINMTFLAMAMANGLTAVILNPLDQELMDALIAAEIILNKAVYCDSFLDAYRKRR